MRDLLDRLDGWRDEQLEFLARLVNHDSGTDDVLDVILTTGYGQLLVAKVVGFAALCGLGWVNRRRYIPLLAKTLEPLTRSLRVEVGIATLVLALTAGLVNQPPAANAINKPYEATDIARDSSVLVQVTPARVGVNDIHMYFYDKAGVSSFDTDAVEVTAAVGDIPPRKLKVTPVTASHQSVYGASLPRPGVWVFRITALRAGKPRTFTVNFDYDSATEFAATSRPMLDELKAFLARHPAPEILVVGHTDSMGRPEYNDQLSLERAETVRKLLVEVGIQVVRMEVVGRGECDPLVTTGDEVREERNRRVEIIVR